MRNDSGSECAVFLAYALPPALGYAPAVATAPALQLARREPARRLPPGAGFSEFALPPLPFGWSDLLVVAHPFLYTESLCAPLPVQRRVLARRGA